MFVIHFFFAMGQARIYSLYLFFSSKNQALSQVSGKLPPMKRPSCENYPPEFFPQENCPLGKLPPIESPPHL